MKKTILTILVCLFAMAMAADSGISFEYGKSWSEIREKAKASNRLIFVDFYTQWCGPCYNMAKTIFTLSDVGTFYNANFVNAKIDAENGEGVELAKKYQVRSYPTYAFIDPSTEEIVHRSSSRQNAEDFIFTGKSALNPELRSTTLLKKYDEGIRDRDFLMSYIKYNHTVYQKPLVQKAFDELVAGGAKLTEADVWDVYDKCIAGYNDYLKQVSDNYQEFCRLIGKKVVDAKLERETKYLSLEDLKSFCDFEGKRFNMAWIEAYDLFRDKKYEEAAKKFDAIIGDDAFDRDEIINRLIFVGRQGVRDESSDFWFNKCVEYLQFIAYNKKDRDDAQIHYEYALALENVIKRLREGKTAPECLFIEPKVGKTDYNTRPDDLKQKPIRKKK